MTTQALTRSTPGRTILDVDVSSINVWPIVEAWADPAGYHIVERSDAHRLYQKGTGMLVAPMMLDLELKDGKLTLQAWVRVSFFVRLMALFLVPAEMNIGSGGFRLVLPRRMARGKVNELLEKLNASPID
jgi:hypothetical protein